MGAIEQYVPNLGINDLNKSKEILAKTNETFGDIINDLDFDEHYNFDIDFITGLRDLKVYSKKDFTEKLKKGGIKNNKKVDLIVKSYFKHKEITAISIKNIKKIQNEINNSKIQKKLPRINNILPKNKKVTSVNQLTTKYLNYLLKNLDKTKEEDRELLELIKIRKDNLEIQNVLTKNSIVIKKELKDIKIEEDKKKKEEEKKEEKEEEDTSSESSYDNSEIIFEENYYGDYSYQIPDGDKIEISGEEQEMVKNNPETLENLINFYTFFKELNMEGVWQYRKELVKSMGTIHINLDDDSLTRSELVNFGNKLVEVINKINEKNTYKGDFDIGEFNETGGQEKIPKYKLKRNTSISGIKSELRVYSEASGPLNQDKSFNYQGDGKFISELKKNGIIKSGYFKIATFRKLLEN